MGFGLGTAWYYAKNKDRFGPFLPSLVSITKAAIAAGGHSVGLNRSVSLRFRERFVLRNSNACRMRYSVAASMFLKHSTHSWGCRVWLRSVNPRPL